jgi:hypothetical protein
MREDRRRPSARCGISELRQVVGMAVVRVEDCPAAAVGLAGPGGA